MWQATTMPLLDHRPEASFPEDRQSTAGHTKDLVCEANLKSAMLAILNCVTLLHIPRQRHSAMVDTTS